MEGMQGMDPAMAWGATPWWYFAAIIITTILGVWLSATVLRKAGFSGWWSILFVVPIVYVVGMWIFAFVRWPRIDRVRTTTPSDYEGGWNVEPRGRTDDQPDRTIAPDPRAGKSWDNDRRS